MRAGGLNFLGKRVFVNIIPICLNYQKLTNCSEGKTETNHCCSLQLAVGRELFLFCNIFSKADGGQIAAALRPYVA